jgi:catechol 2,3-dioxygenase-like lactoylglutathione lyase family enzyme
MPEPRSRSGGLAASAVLPVADLARSLAFYERLGFEVLGQWDDYAILSFGEAELHLAQHPEVDGQPSWSGAYLYVRDLSAVHATWMAAGAREVKPPEETDLGLLEFVTEDLDGNLLRVGSPVASSSASASAESGDGPGVTDRPDERGARERTDFPDEHADQPVSSGPDVAGGMAGSQAIGDETSPPSNGSSATDVPARLPGGPGTDDTEWLPLVASGLPCGGCGLVATELPNLALGAQVREEAHALGDLLRHADDDAIRHRPSPTAWSALEHGVHVRGALHVFADRIVRTLRQDEPELGWWDHEAAIADGMANESDVDAVADDLGRNAALVSESIRLIGRESDWQRRSYRRGVETFTIELLARYTLHEVVHHRTEAARILAAS